MPLYGEEVQPYVTADGVIKVKPAVRNPEGEIVDDPSWTAYLKKEREGFYEQEKLLEGPIPMLVNLGDWGRIEAMIGHAIVYEMSDGRKRLNIILDKEASSALGDLTAIFELKAIGFAGVKRRPQ